MDMIDKQGDKQKSERQIAQLTELKKLSATATLSNKPVVDQLSPQNKARFLTLTKSVNLVSTEHVIFNNRDRDLTTLDHFIQLADKQYRWYQTYMADDNPEKIYSDLLEGLPAIDGSNGFDVSTPKEPACSVDMALFRIELEATTKIEKLAQSVDFAKIQNNLKDLTVKYNVSSVDQAKLTPADQATYDSIMRSVNPLRHEQIFVNQMELLRLMNAASELMFQSGLEDLKTGDYTKVGSTVQRLLSTSQPSPLIVKAMLGWGFVREKLPKPNWPQDPIYIN